VGAAPEVGADGDEPVVDAEIVDDPPVHRWASHSRDLLQGMLAGIGSGALQDAPAETLKEISTAALAISDAIDEVLKNR
jgi:hypothetical protein